MKLRDLAARHGVALSYRTDRDALVTVSRDTVVGVLDALGVDTTGRGWITREVQRFDDARAEQLVDHVFVAWDGTLELAPFTTGAAVTLTLEDGHEVDPASTLPPGYHQLHVGIGGRAARAQVISAPRHAWAAPPPARRRWGVYAPLYALHERGNDGPGDLTTLSRLLDWVAGHGGDTVLTLPLLAAFLDRPVEPSPYSPVSRLMWNELYAAVPHKPIARADDGLLDYDAAAAAVHEGLATEVASLERDPLAAADLARFLAARPDVGDYARFRAAGARYGRNWRAWPATLRDGRIELTDVDPRVVRFHSIAQWLVDSQLRELAGRARDADQLLGLDLALGTHHDGYDVWCHRELFTTRAAAGAPPDTFFVAGQNWGFPPTFPEVARRTGHAYFRAALAHHLRHASLLRIDHVMGLHRLYWVPHGAEPTAGTYVRYPLDELMAIVCLESHRARAVVIGEDLGTVPPTVTRALRRHHVLGTWIAQGTLEARGRTSKLDAPTRRAMASLNTHDMPTFAGFLASRDIDDRLALGQIDAPTAVHQRAERKHGVRAAKRRLHAADERALLGALIDEIGRSDTPIVAISLEDLWLETEPHNVPATTTERPNWRRPARHAVDELDTVPGVTELVGMLAAARRASS